MKAIFLYFRQYVFSLNPVVALAVLLYTAGAVWANYHFQLNNRIYGLSPLAAYGIWFTIFLFSFGGMYALQAWLLKQSWFLRPAFVALIVFAAALFAWKMTADFSFRFTADEAYNAYLNKLLYWPLKLVVVGGCLWALWKKNKTGSGFYGIHTRGFKPAPYLSMLLLMVPLVLLAATQPDFQAVYPKMQQSAFLQGAAANGLHRLIYQLSYGSDFITIELFFRGFLVLGFARFAGREAILPMAVFYCCIHFGKPAGECISSFFGGLVLGVVTYQTRNILGGLMVHLGIAWLMEFAGWLFQ